MIASGFAVAFLPACLEGFPFNGVCYRAYPSTLSLALLLLSRRVEENSAVIALRSLLAIPD